MCVCVREREREREREKNKKSKVKFLKEVCYCTKKSKTISLVSQISSFIRGAKFNGNSSLCILRGSMERGLKECYG